MVVRELILPATLLEPIAHNALILHGIQDCVVPLSRSVRLIDHLPDATLLAVPKCSHCVQIECADLFHAEVARFLSQETTK
ncbi:alpha/beta fold hydrolase [Ancylobacter sp. VNQ12]|uniref:alpha/beta fold hydrolase n=1 Tax=Ancylobacter sp. VNQ12 TaxID=3400920 RepID=UPI003C0811B0